MKPTTEQLAHAKSLGAYHGETTGNISDIAQAWSEWLDENGGLPEFPPSTPQVSIKEVAEMLEKVALGEIVPKLISRQSWKDTYCGDVEYEVGGWRVTIFNDCDDWDYIDHVITPDGRRSEFEDWANAGDGDCQPQPEWLLNSESQSLMENAFIKADH